MLSRFEWCQGRCVVEKEGRLGRQQTVGERLHSCVVLRLVFFFFQAGDGIRVAQESRGLGDVYKRQSLGCATTLLHT